tara:strand:- start:2285 stop:2581 length:297 start_codon:yes stop_codon:yes gene_type:complete
MIYLNKSVDLVEFVKQVYNMSVPMGMGIMHYVDEPLSDEFARSLIDMSCDTPVALDYIKGRYCKMCVFKDNKGLYVRDYWSEHTEDQFVDLLDKSGAF